MPVAWATLSRDLPLSACGKFATSWGLRPPVFLADPLDELGPELAGQAVDGSQVLGLVQETYYLSNMFLARQKDFCCVPQLTEVTLGSAYSSGVLTESAWLTASAFFGGYGL